MNLRVGLAVAALTILSACDDKKAASTVDAGAKPFPSASVRTTRLDCGGTFGSCPAGESCYIDKPGCDATGYCGPLSEPACSHPIAFCGCKGIELACTFPKRPWTDKGPQCFNPEGAGGGESAPTPSASASASASAAPHDAGRDARAH